MRRLVCVLVLALMALGGLASPAAQASNTQLSIMMDDDNLVYRGDGVQYTTLARMQQLGVDYVRVTVLWKVLTHRAGKAARRNGDNPRSYPRGNWDRYDHLVRVAESLHLGVYFNVTGRGPKWAMGKAPKSQRKYSGSWMPKASEYYKFVKAVGSRYNGTYRDENEGRRVLPRVSFWSIYNEPNQPGWLTPQFKGSTPWSPVQYRTLWYYGRKALNATGHEKDIVLIGETAPIGSGNSNAPSPLSPKRFIREFFCVDSRNRPYRGASAARRRCSTLDRILPLTQDRAVAWAHHPYTKKLSPTQRDSDRDSITMANIEELPALLNQIGVSRRGALPAANFAALTEFGYETNPPDPFSGVSLAKQAAYFNQGDYITYKNPAIISNTQFLLNDVDGISKYRTSDKRHWFNYQSGLFFANGQAKPSATAYRLPFMVTRSGGGTTSVWGQLRFLPVGTQTETHVQFRPAGSSDWEDKGAVPVTNPAGFFEATLTSPGPGSWRAAFVEPVSKTVILSRAVNASG